MANTQAPGAFAPVRAREPVPCAVRGWADSGAALPAMRDAARLFWSRRARIFNLDGTLVHTLHDLSTALNQALREMGFFRAVPETLLRASLHAGLEANVGAAAAYLRLPREVHGPLLARYRRLYAATLAERSRPYDGVRELLACLSARGEPMAVCTNKPQGLAEDLLMALGLRPHFAAVIGADTCSERKPHPAPLRRAMAALGARPAAVLMVGDSAVDAACARAVGVPHLWFERGYGAAPPASRWRFGSYAELLQAAGWMPPAAGGAPGLAGV